MINRTTKNRKQKWEEKQMVWYFKRQIDEISVEKNQDIVKKRKAGERNWVSSTSRTKQRHKDYVKMKIDMTQQTWK